MPIFRDTTAILGARGKPDQELEGNTATVSGLPTELWVIIIRMAAHFPLDFDFTSYDPWEEATVFNFKQTMSTKFSLTLVSRQFNGIVSEFMFEFVYISTMQLSMSIASQEEWDRNQLRPWRHGGLRKAMEKLFLAYSPVPRPTNVTDLSSRANTNIRYLFVQENGDLRPNRYKYTVSIANLLKSDCCSNLVGLFIVDDWVDSTFARAITSSIPSGLKLLSRNAQASGPEVSVLLAKLSNSLERLRIRCSILEPSGITLPKMTHFAVARVSSRAGEFECLSGWNLNMPSLTHLTCGFDSSDEPRIVHRTPTLFENVEYLQLRLRSRSSTQIAINNPTMIATPHHTLHPLILICYDLAGTFANPSTLSECVPYICDKFPKLKAVDVSGVCSCVWGATQLTCSEEMQVLQYVSSSLVTQIPRVDVRVMP
ncbi:hypothetical protein BD410DRAFT_864538 [Rickenella mellea]|uniref:Uncharacterized protein n=1 Tax=Rickenella mellea TaxID=50990 RepID=A0A4Y7Q3W5_9AGAM|nr:hypothetical protein BD410DRAFT_864538 [Rickenella mellea]